MREGHSRPNKGQVTTKILLRLTIPYWVVVVLYVRLTRQYFFL